MIIRAVNPAKLQKTADRIPLGYDRRHPIEVSGPDGETEYLDCLRCPCGSGYEYERLNSSRTSDDDTVIDVYDLVCTNRLHRCYLYLNMHSDDHTTRFAPPGLTLVAPARYEGVAEEAARARARGD